eukprot:scaffold12166_cov29-Tisochrysis_lutea.AAC.1
MDSELSWCAQSYAMLAQSCPGALASRSLTGVLRGYLRVHSWTQTSNVPSTGWPARCTQLFRRGLQLGMPACSIRMSAVDNFSIHMGAVDDSEHSHACKWVLLMTWGFHMGAIDDLQHSHRCC